MNRLSLRFCSRPTLLAFAVSATLPALIGTVAHAQTSAAPADPAAPAAPQTRTETVTNAVRRIARESGAIVVADSGVAQKQIPLPAATAAPQSLEKRLDELVHSLGTGATWAKLYLPAPPAGRSTYDGDAVADFAFAQARLFGTVGGAAPAGTVEILGQRVPADRADSYVAGLNLKPVYLVTSTNRSAANAWSQMSREEQQQYAEQQGAQLANADPATRQAFLQQNMAIMKAMMMQLSPDQRSQLFPGVSISVKPIEGNKAFIITPQPPQP